MIVRPEPSASSGIGWIEADYAETLQSMFNSALRYKLPERNALAAITRTDDNLNLFMQFWFDCGKKESLSNEIIAMWRSRSRDLPKLVRIEGLIDLSPTTIDIRGPAWRG